MLLKRNFLIATLSLTLANVASANTTHHLAVNKTEDTFHFLPHVNIDGNIRAFYFKKYFTNRTDNQSAFSLGGKLNLLTDPFYDYFRVGATVYTAQPLGLNPRNSTYVDTSLPGTPLTVVGQAYVQAQTDKTLVRVGNQLVDTPFANAADSRMIPATFQGIFATYKPVENLKFTGMRLTRYKSRISDSFTDSNAYFPSNGGSVAGLSNKRVNGSTALGAQYQQDAFNAQIWGYQFSKFGTLAYGDASYKFMVADWLKPTLSFQIGEQWNDGDTAFNSLGLGKIRSSIYGLQLSTDVGEGQVYIGANSIPKHSSNFHNGDIVSPYTFASDPFYTTSMLAGLVDKAAGTAIKAGGQYYFCDHQLLFKASYAKYNTSGYTPGTTEADIDLNYTIAKGDLKDLSVRGRLAVLTGNPAYGRLVYPRLMLQYNFT